MQTFHTQLFDFSCALLVALLFAASQASSAVLPGFIDLNVAPGSEATPLLRVYGDNAGDELGMEQGGATAHGDVNGDGYDDLIVASRNHTGPGGTACGLVVVIYGAPSLPATQIDLNTAAGTHGETRIYGDDAFDGFGTTVAAGDINNDGYDDVIIGAVLASHPGRSTAGEVIVVYGSGNKPGTVAGSGTVVDLNTTVGARGETRILGDDAGDFLGWGVECGDFNGDNYDDIMMGAFFADPDGRTSAGEVVAVYGGAAKPGTATGSGSVLDLDAAAGNNGETRIYGDDNDDRIGLALAAGDINGDGYDDMLIGTGYADSTGGTDAGEVYVIYGGSTKPGAAAGTGSIVDLSTSAGVNGETRIYGDDAQGRMGDSVASGDINGDGHDEVLIGAPSTGNLPGDLIGEVYIIYGRTGKPGTVAGSGTTIDLNTSFGSSGETRILGEAITEGFGYHVGAADINGDGYEDLVATAPYNPLGSPLGDVFVLYGSSDLLGTPTLAGSVLDLAASPADVKMVASASGDIFGHGAAAGGDIDRDGYAEFSSAAPKGDTPAGADAGYGITVFGDGTAANATAMEAHHAGNTQEIGMGGRLSPVLRTKLRFTGGNESRTSATIYRSATGLSNVATPAEVADVYWELSTTRTAYSFASIRFQYLDSEIAGMDESKLQLFQAPSPSGPWTKAAGAYLDTARNEMLVGVGSLGYFALSTVDVTPPSAISIIPATTGPTNLDLIAFEVTFDEPVEGFDDSSDLIMTFDGVSADAIISGSDAMYTVAIESITGNGTITLAVDTNAEIRDGAGNPIGASVTSATVTIDNLSPGVTLSTSAGDPVGGAISVVLESTEPVFGLDAGDFTSINAMVEDLTGTGNTYTFNLVPTAGGVFGVSLDAAKFTDMAGNGNTVSNSIARSFDPDLPAVTSLAPSTAGPTNADSVSFEVAFNEPVTGFNDANDLLLVHAGTSHAGTSISGGPQTYTVTISGIAGDGSFTLAVSTGGGVADFALNPLAGSIISLPVQIDNTAPHFSNIACQPQDASEGDVVTIYFESDAPFLASPDVYVNGNPASPVAKDGFSYQYLVGPAEPIGPAIIGINGIDLAGNPGYAESSTALNIIAEEAQVPLSAWPLMLTLFSAGLLGIARRRR